MKKKYIVRLSEQERQNCTQVIKKLKGTSQKVRRAQILLKADANGPAWTDAKIADAFNCRVQTIENLRKRLVIEGFDLAFNGKKSASQFFNRKTVQYGRQELLIGDTVVFVLPSTSGAARRFWDVAHWFEVAQFVRS